MIEIFLSSAIFPGPTRTTASAPACWNRQESLPGRSRSKPFEACFTTATRRPRAFRSVTIFSMSVVLPLFERRGDEGNDFHNLKQNSKCGVWNAE